MLKQKRNLFIKRAFLVWWCAALFYAYEFYLRVSPNVMVVELMREYQISAQQLGQLSAAYYYTYALMQIPVGYLIDRCGVRSWLILAGFITSIGCLAMVSFDSFTLALFSRAIIGVGSAFAFIACLRLVANWFPHRIFAFAVGLTNTMGVVGAMSGTALLAWLTHHCGWRESLTVSGIVGLVLTLLMWGVIHDYPADHPAAAKPKSNAKWWRVLRTVGVQSTVWRYAVISGLMVAPVTTFTELWGTSYLQTSLAVSRSVAASLSSLTFIGIALGGPFWGWLQIHMSHHKRWLLLGNLCSMSAMLGLLWWHHLTLSLASFSLFLVGFGTSSMLLCFSVVRHAVAAEHSGVAVGITNTVVMLVGAIFQPLTGYLLDVMHQATDMPVSLIWLRADFQWSLMMIPCSQALVLLWLLLSPEPRAILQKSSVK